MPQKAVKMVVELYVRAVSAIYSLLDKFRNEDVYNYLMLCKYSYLMCESFMFTFMFQNFREQMNKQ